ncbi:MAG: hypothetical protein JWM59_764 [Verrucomicrobiales bacterium]|nr:hypothetical protein [Verrucomicrobiales bacterium]
MRGREARDSRALAPVCPFRPNHNQGSKVRVAFSEPGTHVSIDAMALHASPAVLPVPEVSTGLLALGGMAIMSAAGRGRRNA